MKKIILVTLLTMSAIWAFGQEKYIFNQYFLNPSTINPGANGFNGTHDVLFNYRSTWASFEGAPKTFAFHYNGPIANRLGMGVYLVSDNFANLNQTKGVLNVSYTIDAESYKIGFGLSTEYLQYRLSNVNLSSNLIDETDQALLMRLDDSRFLMLVLECMVSWKMDSFLTWRFLD